MCKSFLLFYPKKKLTFSILHDQFAKTSDLHQIIYNIPYFIKIILFHIFYYYFPYPYTAPPPYLTSLKHSLSFFFSFFFLLASFFFYVFLLQHLLSFFFFFISKKNLFLSPPLFLYQISALFKSEKKNLSTKLPWLNALSLSLSLMAAASLGFGLICILPNEFSVVFYFELILSWVCDDFHWFWVDCVWIKLML